MVTAHVSGHRPSGNPGTPTAAPERAIRLPATLLLVTVLSACTLGTGDNGGSAVEEDYPRLTPWRVVAANEATMIVRIEAVSGACIDIDGQEVGFEPLERVDVEETPDHVTISAWLGEPTSPRPSECAGVGYDIPAEVELSAPLGSRELVDPACALPRFRQFAVCVEED